jgi:diaminopimelate decarboxylase
MITDFNWWNKQKNSLFLYSELELESSLNSIHAFHAQITEHQNRRIYYSVKSNPNTHILRYFYSQGIYFDISSELEFKALMSLGITPQRMSFSGPNKPDRVLKYLFEKKIGTIHLDNLDEWNFLISNTTKTKDKFPQLTLRLSLPNAMTQKLGIPKHDILKILQSAKTQNIYFAGFHVYLGRDSFSFDILEMLCTEIQMWKEQFSEVFPSPQLFLGAGLPQIELLRPQIPAKLSSQNSENLNLKIPIHLEVGRALSNSCGTYAAKILTVKDQRPEPLIIVDGGLQHLASKFSSPKYGDRGYSVTTLCNNQPCILYAIYGSLGIGHDRLITAKLPRFLKRGDWILFQNSGSYGLTGATQQFLGLGQCSEYFIDKSMQIHTTPEIVSYHESWEQS